MSKRKIQILVSACLLIGFGLWILYAFTPPRTDEAKYRDMRRTSRSFAVAVSAERSPSGGLVKPLRMSDRYVKRFDAQREALLASGYLTNVSIMVPDASGRRGQLVKQLDVATRGTDILICQLSWWSPGVVVTCRPHDEVRLRQALGE